MNAEDSARRRFDTLFLAEVRGWPANEPLPHASRSYWLDQLAGIHSRWQAAGERQRGQDGETLDNPRWERAGHSSGP
jgi:hypothetical protein